MTLRTTLLACAVYALVASQGSIANAQQGDTSAVEQISWTYISSIEDIQGLEPADDSIWLNQGTDAIIRALRERSAQDLKRLSLRWASITKEGCKDLAGLGTLEYLDICGIQSIAPEDFADLFAALSSLKYINVSFTTATDLSFARWTPSRELLVFRCATCAVTAKTLLKLIQGSPKLVELSVSRCKHIDNGTALRLGDLKKLETLEAMSCTWISTDFYKAITCLTSLRVLLVGGADANGLGRNELVSLSQLTSVATLSFKLAEGLSSDALNAIAKLQNLRKLSINLHRSDNAAVLIGAGQALSTIHSLAIEGGTLDEKCDKMWSMCDHVKTLTLERVEAVSCDRVEAILKIDSLDTLCLFDCKGGDAKKIRSMVQRSGSGVALYTNE